MWNMPPTCTAGDLPQYAHLLCPAIPDRQVTAYDTRQRDLWAAHTAPVCAKHAEELAAHWRRHGVRTRFGGYLRRPLTRIEPLTANGTIACVHRLVEPLPGMPEKPVRHDPVRHDPAMLRRPLANDGSDGQPPFARLDVSPSDRGNWGAVRRAAVWTLARALDCEPSAALSTKGPWSDRLDLQIYGDPPQVIALARCLNWVLRRCEQAAQTETRAYGAWLRRHDRDGYDEAGTALRRKWRTEFTSHWMDRWARRIALTQDGGFLLRAGLPAGDQDYPADQAATAAADLEWQRLQDLMGFTDHLHDPGPAPAPPRQPELGLLAPRVPLLPRPERLTGTPRTALDHPASAPAPATEPLWTPRQPVAPAPSTPAPAPQPEGRKLLEALADFVVQ